MRQEIDDLIDRTGEQIICKNKKCKLYNVKVLTSDHSYYDAKLGRSCKFGVECPFCGRKFKRAF